MPLRDSPHRRSHYDHIPEYLKPAVSKLLDEGPTHIHMDLYDPKAMHMGSARTYYGDDSLDIGTMYLRTDGLSIGLHIDLSAEVYEEKFPDMPLQCIIHEDGTVTYPLLD